MENPIDRGMEMCHALHLYLGIDIFGWWALAFGADFQMDMSCLVL